MEVLLKQVAIFFNVKLALNALHDSIDWNYIEGRDLDHDAEYKLAVCRHQYIYEREVRDNLDAIDHSPQQIEWAR